MNGWRTYTENSDIPNIKSESMNRQAKVKYLFRQINNGLSQLETLPRADRMATIEGLKQINEELCDYVVELVKRTDNEQRTIREAN